MATGVMIAVHWTKTNATLAKMLIYVVHDAKHLKQGLQVIVLFVRVYNTDATIRH